MTITAIHRYSSPCGRVAFYYDEEGCPRDRVEAERVTLPDGTKPSRNETMKCGTCGAEIGLEAIDLVPGEWDVKVSS